MQLYQMLDVTHQFFVDKTTKKVGKQGMYGPSPKKTRTNFLSVYNHKKDI